MVTVSSGYYGRRLDVFAGCFVSRNYEMCYVIGKFYLDAGAGEPINPVEFYVEGVSALPSVGACHVPGGGKVAEVALERRVVVGQGVELGFYPLAVAKGDGVFASICVAYVQ